MTVNEVGEGVPIGKDEDEPARVGVWKKRRGGRCRRASPRAPSNLPCHTVVVEEEAGEVDANVEVEVRGRQAMGDAIPISDRVNQKEIQQQQQENV